MNYSLIRSRSSKVIIINYSILGSGSLAAMAVFEDGYKPDMTVGFKSVLINLIG